MGKDCKRKSSSSEVDELHVKVSKLINDHVKGSVKVKDDEIELLNKNIKSNETYFRSKLMEATQSILDQQERLLKTNRDLFSVMKDGINHYEKQQDPPTKPPVKKVMMGSKPIAVDQSINKTKDNKKNGVVRDDLRNRSVAHSIKPVVPKKVKPSQQSHTTVQIKKKTPPPPPKAKAAAAPNVTTPQRRIK
eukprot:CAMPEP_0117421866 /NCGR_PEP_ID=MMETSP0758-20121206/2832_1 /TAXON_ID=63605 /ORGANISM="Percolomonas cosmopolitus, Strain AE-1 (ATCC 50343)" /LENGTH=190 /DNA_ID=CAMNT_0005204167 /DNA_START=112 /DNA_END=681 /DNA_ORIENTATION=+